MVRGSREPTIEPTRTTVCPLPLGPLVGMIFDSARIVICREDTEHESEKGQLVLSCLVEIGQQQHWKVSSGSFLKEVHRP